MDIPLTAIEQGEDKKREKEKIVPKDEHGYVGDLVNRTGADGWQYEV